MLSTTPASAVARSASQSASRPARSAAPAGRRARAAPPRDVGASVFGAWRSPPVIESIDFRRLLEAAPLAGSVLLPRPQSPAQHEQQHQKQRQQHEREQLTQQHEQRLLQQLEQLQHQQAADAAAAVAAPKPLRLSWAGSGVYFW